MRTPLLAAFFGLSLVACTGVIGDPGPGGGDDDVVPGPDCGDSVINAGETCDDGNNVSGDGCSQACSVEASPALSVTVDNNQVMTELMTETMLTVTLTSSGGFSGPVTLSASAVNAQSAPIGWTVTFNQASVDVPEDGTATAVATVKIPSENMGLAGTIKFDAASSLGTTSTSSAVTVLNQVTIPMTLQGNGGCVPPTTPQFSITNGTTVRWQNKSTEAIRIHIDGGGTNFDHEPAPGTAAGLVFEQKLTTSTGTAGWYCHDREGDQGYRISAKPAA